MKTPQARKLKAVRFSDVRGKPRAMRILKKGQFRPKDFRCEYENDNTFQVYFAIPGAKREVEYGFFNFKEKSPNTVELGEFYPMSDLRSNILLKRGIPRPVVEEELWPALKRKGIGTTVLKKVEETFRGKNISWICVTPKDGIAKKFYIDNGYQESKGSNLLWKKLK